MNANWNLIFYKKFYQCQWKLSKQSLDSFMQVITIIRKTNNFKGAVG